MRDSNGDLEVEADSAKQAAEAFVARGDWGNNQITYWVTLAVTLLDEQGEVTEDTEQVTIAVDPDEPACLDGESHDWQSPVDVVGGNKENPGVFGHGGGVIIKEICSHCGLKRTIDTWAQNPDNGEQGLRSIKFSPTDAD